MLPTHNTAVNGHAKMSYFVPCRTLYMATVGVRIIGSNNVWLIRAICGSNMFFQTTLPDSGIEMQ